MRMPELSTCTATNNDDNYNGDNNNNNINNSMLAPSYTVGESKIHGK
eukprot:CAMPEP_0170815222 /NCGR_PEP_ID=MMETSP0733-20121128/38301_1 /TAXON_ID=186038 /ORGANISM="Fragilariopsis kerguelensis, Strain L26-C5" /LENGTH=46 /DNA_ID= /DNA_START= /DNA_END= /DNA_ORIENTATION=